MRRRSPVSAGNRSGTSRAAGTGLPASPRVIASDGAGAGMADAEWYYARGDQQQGPVPLQTLRDLAGAGQLLRTDLVWRVGTPDRRPAGEVPEVFENLAGPSATGMPPPAAPPPAVPGRIPGPGPAGRQG